MIHQGTRLIPCDFIAFGRPLNLLGQQHDMLWPMSLPGRSPCLRQDRSGSARRRLARLASATPHLSWKSPVEHYLMERLTPAALGKLVALYEHSVFVQGAVWGIVVRSVINWKMPRPVTELATADCRSRDSSTNALIRLPPLRLARCPHISRIG
jgi:glucose-6-phosphate isomerase